MSSPNNRHKVPHDSAIHTGERFSRSGPLHCHTPVQQKLLDYLALLAKWNKVHNLTAVREVDDMVTLHLLTAFPYSTICTVSRYWM